MLYNIQYPLRRACGGGGAKAPGRRDALFDWALPNDELINLGHRVLMNLGNEFTRGGGRGPPGIRGVDGQQKGHERHSTVRVLIRGPPPPSRRCTPGLRGGTCPAVAASHQLWMKSLRNIKTSVEFCLSRSNETPVRTLRRSSTAGATEARFSPAHGSEWTGST